MFSQQQIQLINIQNFRSFSSESSFHLC